MQTGEEPPLDLNWMKLLSSEERSPADAMIVSDPSEGERQALEMLIDDKQAEQLKANLRSLEAERERRALVVLTDQIREKSIERLRERLASGVIASLWDRGEKLKAKLQLLEAERERRNLEMLTDDQLAEKIELMRKHLASDVISRLPDRGEKMNANRQSLTDPMLEEKIKRLRKHLASDVTAELADRGEKLKSNLQSLEAERERRKSLVLSVDNKDEDECKDLEVLPRRSSSVEIAIISRKSLSSEDRLAI